MPADTVAVTVADASALAALIPSGSCVAVPKGENPDVPMAIAMELVRRGVRDLHLVTLPACAWPASGMMVDILVGAGCVATVETSGVSFSELGAAPRFTAAVKAASIRVIDATCPAVYAAVQAGAKGQPFTTLRGLIGTDLMAQHDDWTVIDNPFAPGDKVAALKALNPDVAMFHAPLADRHGNLWIGRNRDLMTLAHASDIVVATVDAVVDEDFLADELRAAGTIPAFYITALAKAPGAFAPLQVDGPTDLDFVRAYLAAAKTQEGFDAWLSSALIGMREAAE
jgi:glutaconate CoA-transferase subunit A